MLLKSSVLLHGMGTIALTTLFKLTEVKYHLGDQI